MRSDSMNKKDNFLPSENKLRFLSSNKQIEAYIREVDIIKKDNG